MTPPSPSIAVLIAELRHNLGSPIGFLELRRRIRLAISELEKLATAEETRVRDISRLTIERDTARDVIEAMAKLHGDKSQQYVDERKAHEATKADLAAAKGALRNHVINHWYNGTSGFSIPHKCSCDACNGEWFPNEPEKHVGDCAAALQPKVETP